jgi:hypothetical protein
MTACFRLTKYFPRNLTLKFSPHFFHVRHLHGHLFPQQNANFDNEFPNNVSTFTFPLFPIILYAFHYALNCNLSIMDDIKMDLMQIELDSVYWSYLLRQGPLAGPCEHVMVLLVFLKYKVNLG